MSRFYASIQGNRGEATRCGSKDSGIKGHIRGWKIGVRVYIDVDPKTGEDRVQVYKTGGTNGSENGDELIAEFTS